MRFVALFSVLVSTALLISCAERTVPEKREEAGPAVAALPVPPPPPVARPRPAKPLSAIGRVNRQGGGFCSGILIASEKVLTTARCLWDVRLRRWIAIGDLHFVAGYHLGNYLAHRRVKAIALPNGITMTAPGIPRKITDNWAILTLDRPIGPVTMVRPIPLARLNGRPRANELGQLLRAGYGRRRPHAIESVRCKAVTVLSPRVLLHDCGAALADAGFPILIRTPEGLRVLGLQMISIEKARGGKGLGRALLVTAMDGPRRKVIW